MDGSFSSPIKSDLTEQILADIIKLIEKRQYEPGERLPSERWLAERFKTGRGIIREALTILENLRYLEKRPNSGMYVRSGPGRDRLAALRLFAALEISLLSSKRAEDREAHKVSKPPARRDATDRTTSEERNI